MQNKRDLNEEDMLTWQDGLKLINETNSVQIKAIIALQLDAGLRPSEFVNLNYEDVKQKGDFLVVNVREGKTGKREFPTWRCVPFVLKWLASHKTKKSKDPLWTQETQTNGKIKRYEYPALLKRINDLKKTANLKQPVDFYNLRHSSCYLDKLDNLPLDIAASRHGHSVKFFVEVYGRLGVDDIINRIKKHNGADVQERKKAEQNITCPRCSFINAPHSEICEHCGAALSMKKALEVEKDKNERIKELERQITEMPQMILEMIKNKESVLEVMKAKN